MRARFSRLRLAAVPVAALAITGLLAGCEPTPVGPPPNNVNPAKANGVGVRSIEATMTPDGRYVAFVASVADIVPGVSGYNVYRLDRSTNKTQLVSLKIGGPASGSLHIAHNPSISDDGRYIVWDDTAHLVDDNDETEIFLRDMTTQTVQVVTRTPSGGKSDGGSANAFISPNGRWVAFTSRAANLTTTPVVDDSQADVFRWDRTTKAMVRVTVGRAADGSPTETTRSSETRDVFDDGRVAVSSRAWNLIQGKPLADTNAQAQYVVNPANNTVFVVSQAPNGTVVREGQASYSADGKIALLNDQDPAWGFPDQNNSNFIVRNLQTGASSLGPKDAVGLNLGAYDRSIVSADGRFVLFSTPLQIVAGTPGTTDHRHAYVWDRSTNKVVRIDHKADGSSNLGISNVRGITKDGKTGMYDGASEPGMFTAPDASGDPNTVITPTKI